ncbi:uncharacterized protein LOC110241375 [Exaiptasia diaphana]|uniref:Uncharacterized protein n=1 Tax=Exaiptasia diaphana TaxID=2652724 RepID=A0A913XDQ0_EXADI|nr:uncharacterized protein LOC110241375 [Exaiptasia diaphana]
MCFGIRCLMLAIFYVLKDISFNHHDHVIIPKVLFPTENFFRLLEILFLTLTLEHQRKHRSKGFIQDVMENFNQHSYENTNTLNCRYICNKLFCSTYSVFIGQALIGFGFLAATFVFVLREKPDESKLTAALYWTYNGCLWTMSISCVVLTFIILCTSTIHETYQNQGPSIKTKVLLAVGIGLSLPGNIPVFIWQSCIFKATQAVAGYYVVLPLMFAAVCLFMAVLIQEFNRLKEEAQWSAIDQAEANNSITESI